MDRYTFQDSDRMYRLIDLTCYSPELPPFRAKDRDSIPLKMNMVLEVQDEKGAAKKYVFTDSPKDCPYLRDGNRFRLPEGIPVAWLWVREKARMDRDGNLLNPYRLRYKAPEIWQVQDSMQYCAFPAIPSELELVGDETGYFAAAYDLY